MLFYILITYIYFFNSYEYLIIINANLFIFDNLVDLIKERSNSKFIVSYIYKFLIFKLNSILFYYIY